MKVVVKECDRFKSTLHKNRYISEYLIYIMIDDIPIECHSAIGEDAKNDKLLELATNHFPNSLGNINENNEIVFNSIKQLSLKEFLSQY